jgi:hypothetical protein
MPEHRPRHNAAPFPLRPAFGAIQETVRAEPRLLSAIYQRMFQIGPVVVALDAELAPTKRDWNEVVWQQGAAAHQVCRDLGLNS